MIEDRFKSLKSYIKKICEQIYDELVSREKAVTTKENEIEPAYDEAVALQVRYKSLVENAETEIRHEATARAKIMVEEMFDDPDKNTRTYYHNYSRYSVIGSFICMGISLLLAFLYVRFRLHSDNAYCRMTNEDYIENKKAFMDRYEAFTKGNNIDKNKYSPFNYAIDEYKHYQSNIFDFR